MKPPIRLSAGGAFALNGAFVAGLLVLSQFAVLNGRPMVRTSIIGAALVLLTWSVLLFGVLRRGRTVTLEVVLRYLRMLDELPDHTDQLFVVDRDARLKGLLPVNRLLVSEAEALVADVMLRDYTQFNPMEKAREAAAAFERYDLVSAPVVDDDGRLVGRVTVNAVVDYIREAGAAEMLSAAGLREDEDLFASVWKSVRNRWTWLAVKDRKQFRLDTDEWRHRGVSGGTVVPSESSERTETGTCRAEATT